MWQAAKLSRYEDHVLKQQQTSMLDFETIEPVEIANTGRQILVDFGSEYVGYLRFKAKGNSGDAILIHYGQELQKDGNVRFELRCNCRYEERMILAEEEKEFDCFDYKAFRYVQLTLPKGCEVTQLALIARHYPFELKAGLRPEYAADPELKKIWELWHLFRDGERTEHISLVGNIFPFAFNLCPEKECAEQILKLLTEQKISSILLFCTFPALEGMVRYGRDDLIKEALLEDGAWKRMLAEGATTTFEGWGKDSKWNTSLFHLTLSYAAVFMADINLQELFS